VVREQINRVRVRYTFPQPGCAARRFRETEWQNWLKAENTFFVAASYQDKYGPLGKIAVLAGDLTGMNSTGKQFQVRTWVMSCRAFFRLIEYECLRLALLHVGRGRNRVRFPEDRAQCADAAFLQRICNQPAGSSCRVSRTQFMAACPALNHIVEELPNG
jgi:hypothetical protein